MKAVGGKKVESEKDQRDRQKGTKAAPAGAVVHDLIDLGGGAGDLDAFLSSPGEDSRLVFGGHCCGGGRVWGGGGGRWRGGRSYRISIK